MQLVTRTTLIDAGTFTSTPAWKRILSDIEAAIDAVRWPKGAKNFTIYPEPGKKRGMGNGVKPIKEGFVLKLASLGWKLENQYPGKPQATKKMNKTPEEIAAERTARLIYPGAFDAALDLSAEGELPFIVEWETGNVSSSHRALNKMGMALTQGKISGGILVVPTRKLYHFLTDRVGNLEELMPYFPFFSSLAVQRGYFGVIAVEHDAESWDVPKISKGTDGRALI